MTPNYGWSRLKPLTGSSTILTYVTAKYGCCHHSNQVETSRKFSEMATNDWPKGEAHTGRCIHATEDSGVLRFRSLISQVGFGQLLGVFEQT